MAYDQNALPNSLRPIHIARTLGEEYRIVAPVTLPTNNPLPREVPSVTPATIPVYHPSTTPVAAAAVAAADAGYVGLNCGNVVPAVANWLPRMPPPVTSGIGLVPGYGYSTSLVPRGYDPSLAPVGGGGGGSNASDHTSDEGGDDSVSGRKVKFLCSYGGKILPRPSDGVLRYVGGDTRIISVRRDVGFNELLQKMFDSYGRNVVIKYQLPEEDLDALVTVSRPDDLENMMDEYDKLVERSSDGSAKLRVFLFTELESSSVIRFKDLQDSGQKYVEAVNGIGDGFGGSSGGGGGSSSGAGFGRKGSIASASSTQNSELSGTEGGADSIGHDQGEVNGPPSAGLLSPGGSSASGVPVAKSVTVPASPSQSEHELEISERMMPVHVHQQRQLGYDLQQPGATIPPPAPYVQSYVDPRHGTFNRTEYVQVPAAQMGFPSQVMGTVGPVYSQPQLYDNVVGMNPHQFIPPMHMTSPSTHISFKPNPVPIPVPVPVPQLVQQQEVRMEHFPEVGQRIVHLPSDQSYTMYQHQPQPQSQSQSQSQIPTPVIPGPYGWNPVPSPEQVPFSEGRVPTQQLLYPETVPRFDGCIMCQKALPHAHSDPMAHERRGSPRSTVSDMNPVYQSMRLEDTRRIMQPNRVPASGALVDSNLEMQGVGVRSRYDDHEAGRPQFEGVMPLYAVQGQYVNDRTISQRAETGDQAMVSSPLSVVGLAGEMQSPYGVLLHPVPHAGHESLLQQSAVTMQSQAKQETVVNTRVSGDSNSAGVPSPTSDSQVHESPREYPGNFPIIVPKEDNVESGFTYDSLIQIDARMKDLRIRPHEVLVNNDQSSFRVENPREDVLENRPMDIGGKELNLDNPLGKPQMVLDANYITQNEMMPYSSEVPRLHGFQPMESYGMAQQPLYSSPEYPHASVAMVGNEGSSAFSGVDSAHMTEGNSPVSEWNVYPLQFDRKSDVEPELMDSLNPFNGSDETQDGTSSLFSNQDPWMLRHDSHFPPPRPNKFLTKKEAVAKEAFVDNRLGHSGESPTGDMSVDDGAYQPNANLDLNFSVEDGHSNIGSAEELIKQELQAVAEGVAASVLHSSTPSNPDSSRHGRSEHALESNQSGEAQNSNADVQPGDKDLKTKLPEKTNLGFPVSDGLGRLQIIKNSDLEELRELGSGTFGTVYHGKWRGSDVAIKRINDRCFAGKASEQERMREDFWNEAIKLADLHHPNVVAFYGVVLDGPGGSIATVTEYMVNGSLRTALQKNERNLDKRKRLLIAMDVAFGMEYLHGKNIVHFDLKSDNLLVNLRDPHRPICKVGDLGLSKVKRQTLISGGVRGTLPWMAPELLNGSSSLVSEKVDVFSFGIVMWELLTGDEPYADLHYGAIIGGIVSNTLRPAVPESCDPEWRILMERCWCAEPSERPSFTEVANQLRTITSKVPPKVQAYQ
ncbi:uncharacterized protein LOC112501804 isoform X2 [Cynara cardunculus var. scolymus]|uniref:uncharacterized protein LOC112501804 isoform X2 n=1 Tax=Cynara cardunculus var. scolymus TaxID=59895 RepID=UPI000D62EC21|nr:uncharacterized protein LOC112501804 isoform X2 [Cynara cardunculus var. scolymus]